MKAHVYVDERYPYYYIYEGASSGYGFDIEFTEKELEDFKRVEEEFDAWQGILSDRCDKAKVAATYEKCRIEGIPSKGFS